ncbi:MAG: hypothetical protein M1840_005761 [Geoglossum simile]|nr:MAG: hypothetical protein M1840_005761 [Geoglossum simile]
MSNLEPAILDCKVYVRRFLIKHQSPLGDISLSPHGRNVVFVPVHSPETSHGIVALRLFRGPSASNELERDVGFTYMKDLVEHFEKYEELGVSTEPYCQYAHGVVLKEGGSDGFSYRRGDKLWLFDKLASQLKDGGILAPVVNLRTSEYGFINITDVCWYPDVSGPGDDLWTVLGPFREIRGKKAGTSIHTVYRVNQPVSLERQAFGQVRIDGGSMDKTERKALYLQKMQVMCGYQQSIGRPFLLPKTLSPPVPAATTSPPVKSSRRKRTAKKKNVGLEDKFETICLNETLPTPDFTKMQSVFSVTQQWTGNATLASSQADNPQISLFGLDNSEHGLRMDNTYWTPIGSPDPPNSSVGAINLDPTPCFDWPVPPDLDLYADCGGVRILESPENLADTLRKRSLDRSRWPYRPYGSFSTDSFSGFSSTTTVPAWWGSNIIIARRGFNKTADGQIEIETGEAITEVERIAATDITQEVTAQPIILKAKLRRHTQNSISGAVATRKAFSANSPHGSQVTTRAIPFPSKEVPSMTLPHSSRAAV